MTTRVLSLLLSFLLASASWPASASAQIRNVVRISPVSVPSVVGFGLPSRSLSAVSIPALPVVRVPTLQVVARPAVVQPLSVCVQAAQALTRALPQIPIDAAPRAAAQSFALLTGEPASPSAGDGVFAGPDHTKRPAALPAPEAAKNVRRMMIGTAAMKSGMEVVTLSVPLLALQAFGGATMVAALLVAYGVAQAVFAGASGALADRFMAHKVLAGAVASQAALVAAVVTLGAVNLLTATTLLPLYVLIGGAVGIAETTRHSIPALILGADGDALSKYNASLHIAYEVAGVSGALAAGALLGFAGPLWALLIQPPAYLLASYIFMSVRHERPAANAQTALVDKRIFATISEQVKAYIADVKAGAKLVLGDGRLRWVALAFVIPQIVHRLIEGLLVPVIAKTVLLKPQASAWMLTASNTGELLGAGLLLKFAARFPWIKWGAAGLLAIWALAFSSALPVLLAAILVSSLTWAASDLSLRSKVQSVVTERDQPRALSFLYGTFVLGTALASLAVGGLIDWLGAGAALYWICGAVTALAAGVFLASLLIDKAAR